MFRYVNALCYAVTGIAVLGLEAKSGWSLMMTLVGIISLAYAGYVGLTKRSYWVSSYTYIIPVIAICWAGYTAFH